MSRSRSASLICLTYAVTCPVLSAVIFLVVRLFLWRGQSAPGFLLLTISVYLWLVAALFLLASIAFGTTAIAAHHERVPWLPGAALVLLLGILLQWQFKLLPL